METTDIRSAFEIVFKDKTEYDLPIRWNGEDFYYTLYTHLERYKKDVKGSLDRKEYKVLMEDIENVCDSLCEAVHRYLKGSTSEAYSVMKETLDRFIAEDIYSMFVDVEELKKESLFRIIDVHDRAKHDRKSIFHAPFCKRNKVATTRYSIPGVPTLYLSTTLGLCMEETSKDISSGTIMAARFEINTEHKNPMLSDVALFDNNGFKVLDLSVRPNDFFDEKNKTKLPDVSTYFVWYPILAACSYIRAEKGSPFSMEYIIPQIVAQWMHSLDRQAVCGIRYLSCVSKRISKLGKNYAFPSAVISHMLKDYCPRLVSRFMLTEPVYICEYESVDECEKKLCDENLKSEYIENLDEIKKNIKGTYKIPSGEREIGLYAFSSCDQLTKIEIPSSITSIGDMAFYYCEGLSRIEIPGSVTDIGVGVFAGCSGLTNIKVRSNNKSYDSRDNCNAVIETKTNRLVAGCKNTNVPDSVTSIGDLAFFGCRGLTEIIIPGSVTDIGDGAFSGCRGLKKIKIPDSVTSIGDGAFSDCRGLTEIKIPDSVTSIGESAFDGCSGLTEIIIPGSVTDIGDGVFVDCSGLTNIKVRRNNKTYDSRDNCNAVIETKINRLVSGCKNTNVPDSVTSIGDKAFALCSGLTEVKIPDSVTSIGFGAFAFCSGLTEVKIPDSVTSIGESTFGGCRGLTEIRIPDSVTSIGDKAFSGCRGLKKIKIPDSVTSIGDGTFFGCRGLTEIIIPGSVTDIGHAAFWGCRGLTEIRIPEGVTSIGDMAFGDCRGLKKIKIPDSVTSIGDGAFIGCSGLTEITVDKNNKFYHVKDGKLFKWLQKE